MPRLLDNNTRELVEREKKVLLSVAQRLEQGDSKESDVRLVRALADRLDDLFMLVVVGEFNSGKSSFLNTLLGAKYLAEGVTPTTSKINLIRHGDTLSVSDAPDEPVRFVHAPAPWLRDISLVDTPGTNAVIRAHERITQDFVPRSDLVLFVTSCDRAFSESERRFLSLIDEWSKKVVVVLSKIDMLASEAELDQVDQFVRSHMREQLNREPLIFPVSSRLAAKPETRAASRFDELQRFILETLDQRERMRLKLLSPIGVARRTIARLSDAVDHRRAALAADAAALRAIEDRVAAHRRAMERDMRGQLAAIDNVLAQLGERAQAFIDSELVLTNALSLLDAKKIQARFEERVGAPAAADINADVSRLSDWLLERTAAEWSAIIDIARNAMIAREGQLPPVSGKFEYHRAELLEKLSLSASSAITSFDRMIKTDGVAEQLRNAIISTFAVELGVAGFAGLFAATLLDLTMVLPVAVGGLVIVPMKRRRLKAQTAEQVTKLRNDMLNVLRERCNERVEGNIGDIFKSLSAFREFAKTELENVERAAKSLQDSDAELLALQTEIERQFGKVGADEKLPETTKTATEAAAAAAAPEQST
jgi:GTP-binding protein EngB required for normal cell division